jgi:nucleoside-diphosphate-sugar epimerase
MSSLANSRIPKGSEILVTGITGYIGSWVAYEALALGYKVRGAVRNVEKAAWLQEVFDSKFGPGNYTNVKLTAVADKEQLQAAVQGVAGIAHVSINSNLTPVPEPYVQEAIDETLNVLEVASATPSVKAVVLTSSSMASVPWGFQGTITKDHYNEEYIGFAYDKELENPAKQFFVYAAAKAKAEQAAWKYFEEKKPHYSLNQVLPSVNFGPSVSFKHQGFASTGGWAKSLYDGDLSMIQYVPAQYYIDVRDDAKLHVAGLVDPETNGERLFGFAEPQNWNTVLALLRKIYPEHKFVDDLADVKTDTSKAPTESALKTLKNVYGFDSWTSLETTLKEAQFDRKE